MSALRYIEMSVFLGFQRSMFNNSFLLFTELNVSKWPRRYPFSVGYTLSAQPPERILGFPQPVLGRHGLSSGISCQVDGIQERSASMVTKPTINKRNRYSLVHPRARVTATEVGSEARSRIRN